MCLFGQFRDLLQVPDVVSNACFHPQCQGDTQRFVDAPEATFELRHYPKPDEPEPNRWLSNLRRQKGLGCASKFGRSTDSRPLYLFPRMQVELVEPLWVQAIEAISC